VISVSTPGGGGFGAPAERTAVERERDVALGYYTAEESRRLFGTPA
jgi:N-methylhydantoinase B